MQQPLSLDQIEAVVRNAALLGADIAPETAKALAAEIRRLRADAAAELLPAWEAVYEPGNVSDYLIGYTNDETPAKAAAEAWLRSQAEVTGRLEWAPWGTATAMPDGYDAWFELVEHHGDGIPTGPGLIVRRRAAAEETHIVADDSSGPEPYRFVDDDGDYLHIGIPASPACGRPAISFHTATEPVHVPVDQIGGLIAALRRLAASRP